MGKLTILCVDDELNGLTGREFLLRRHGYEVIVTTSSHEGLELLRSAEVDAVLLDYRRPEMRDVLAACMKRLKPEVPIMLLSAHDNLPQAALRSTDTFLSKSAPPKEFVVAVDNLISTRTPFFHRWLQSWKRRLSA